MTGVRAGGSLVTLTRAAHGGGWNLAGPGPASLRPHRSGWVTLTYAGGCPALLSGRRAGYQTLLLAADGGQVRVRFPAPLNLICGLQASGFGVPARPPTSSTSPLNVLAATVTIPRHPDRGDDRQLFGHRAQHQRQAARPVPLPLLHPILAVLPGNAHPVTVQQHFCLNCAAARQVPAHGSVTLAMRIPVPAAAGRAKYDWQLQDTNVATAAMVTVREP